MNLVIRIGWKEDRKIIKGERVVPEKGEDKQGANWRGCKIERKLLNVELS